jgi:hypothetical protein
MIATESISEEASLVILDRLFDTSELPTDDYCQGKLEDFFTNKHTSPEKCSGCSRFSTCDNTHFNMMSRIEEYHADCFGKKAWHGWSTLEDKKCRNCFVAAKCTSTTAKINEPAIADAKVIEFDSPPPAVPSTIAPALKVTDASLFITNDFLTAMVDMQSKSITELFAWIREATILGYTLPQRVQFLAASLELNNRGILPAYRPSRRAARPEKDKPYSVDDALLSNDHRLIDIDYIAKHHPDGHGDIFSSLINKDGALNYEMAWKFISTRGKAEKKAELLQITPAQQVELFILRDEYTRKRWNWILKNRRKHLVMITAAINAGHGRKKGDPEHIWQLYSLWVMNNWNTYAVIQSAHHLPHTSTPAQIRKSIDWLKQKSKLPGHTELL